MSFGLGNINKTQEEVVKRLHGDKTIWVIVFLLVLISVAVIYSASSTTAFSKHTTNFGYLMRQLKYLVVALTALYICYRIPLKWYRYFATPALVMCTLLLIIPAVLGKATNGATRWIPMFGGKGFQPSEFAKVAIVLYLAKTLEVCKLETFKEFVFKILVPIGIICILIMQGGFSAAVFVALVSFIILFAAGIKRIYLLKTVGIAAAVMVLLILLHFAFGMFTRMDTADSRIKRFFNKEEVDTKGLTAQQRQEIADKTLQSDMAEISISSGGILGKGPGKSTQRYVLPHPESDFIYATIIEEYGLAGGIFVMMLYMWLLYRCIMIVKECKTVFSTVLAAGLGLTITLQAFLHILVNVGILPVTGHTLPLVSSGGTSLLAFSCALGMILSVSRTKEMESIKEEENTEVAENAAGKEFTENEGNKGIGNSVAGGGNEELSFSRK